MCPMCMTTAVLVAGSVASAGGLAAIAVKLRAATARNRPSAKGLRG